MSKVTFPCERCGKMTAVRVEFLGKKVRCPHCQEIINTPPTVAATEKPPEPARFQPETLVVSPPPAVIEESIFEPDGDGAGDALFAGPVQPLVEMPAEPPASSLLAPTEPEQEPARTDDNVYEPAGAVAAENWPAVNGETDHSEGPFSSPAPAPHSFAANAGAEATASEDENLATPAFPPPRRAARGGLLVPIVMIFLIPYCIFSTIAIGVLYMMKQQPSLEFLPDNYPDKKSGGPARVLRVPIGSKVPAKLVGRLGQVLNVGALEIIPRKVEWVGKDRLRLVLDFRDISGAVEFNPVTNQFLEFNRIDRTVPRPYTFLEAVGAAERIYGGTWQTFQEGKVFAGRLKPGEAMTAQLITDPRDANLVEALRTLSGTLRWRIQVRRGFVEYQGKEYSATAVVGVEFRTADIEQRGQVKRRPQLGWHSLPAAAEPQVLPPAFHQ